MKIKLYYKKSVVGTEYLCSSNVPDTNKGSYDSQYIVRIDDITQGAELTINEQAQPK